MNSQAAQPIKYTTSRSGQPLCLCHDMPRCPEQATVEINVNELEHITELLHILDVFLRHTNTIGDHLAGYLRATKRDRPQPPTGTSYDANLRIDQVSFTAHALRRHQPTTAEIAAGHR
jgi:hypothetical protein